jgi:hypothetical protein
MTKTKTLQDRLARTLDQANAAAAKTRPRQKAIAPPLPEKHCKKISISLFDADLRAVADLRAYVLEKTGESIPTSQVIKIALRTAPKSPELCKALDAARQEDGRKWQ